MKISIKNLFLLPALIAGLVLITAGHSTAQTFTNLHNFTFGADGGLPRASVVLSGSTLYGTTQFGGSSGNGAVFAVNINGTGFTNLHSFVSTSDGANPQVGLVLAGDTLYGAAESGGGSGFGTIFSVRTNGAGFTNLHSFAGASDGIGPVAGLILVGATLYGTAQNGGSGSQGTVFAVNTDGTGFINLHNFVGSPGDGINPRAGLVLIGSTLYGTATGGGSSGQGTVFKLSLTGTDYLTQYSFTGSDGSSPQAKLIASGSTLYGTANGGGSFGQGTVFAIQTDGTGFTNLHSFTFDSGSPSFTNSDGSFPSGELLLSGSSLYGTAFSGGGSANGTIFQINTNGTGFTTLHTFTGGAGGGRSSAGLVLSDNTLYGTGRLGGTGGGGTVFSLSLGSVSAPQLTIIPSGTNVILTWPDAPGFTLQSAPSVTGTFTNIVPVATSPYTNAAVAAQRFFRLSQ